MTGMDGEEGWLKDSVADCIEGMLNSFDRDRQESVSVTTCELILWREELLLSSLKQSDRLNPRRVMRLFTTRRKSATSITRRHKRAASRYPSFSPSFGLSSLD